MQEVVKKDGSNTPLFLGGLSMGGMIAILAAIRDQTKWQVCLLYPVWHALEVLIAACKLLKCQMHPTEARVCL